MEQYITINDIQNTSLQAFPDSEKQKAVDATNAFYVAHAASHEVEEIDIIFPIQLFVKDALVAYCEMNMAKNRITGANTNDGPSKYDVIYSLQKEFYLSAINRVNVGLIKGINNKKTSTFTMISVERGI